MNRKRPLKITNTAKLGQLLSRSRLFKSVERARPLEVVPVLAPESHSPRNLAYVLVALSALILGVTAWNGVPLTDLLYAALFLAVLCKLLVDLFSPLQSALIFPLATWHLPIPGADLPSIFCCLLVLAFTLYFVRTITRGRNLATAAVLFLLPAGASSLGGIFAMALLLGLAVWTFRNRDTLGRPALQNLVGLLALWSALAPVALFLLVLQGRPLLADVRWPLLTLALLGAVTRLAAGSKERDKTFLFQLTAVYAAIFLIVAAAVHQRELRSIAGLPSDVSAARKPGAPSARP